MGYLSHQLLNLAKQVGNILLADYPPSCDYTLKSDQSPLTKADLLSDKLLQAGLKKLTPHIPILSEESPASLITPIPPRYWLIDPLDGTREFIKGTGEFTLNIALVESNQAVRGLIYAPIASKAYYATRGQGAFKQQGDEAPRRIQTRFHTDNTAFKISISHSHYEKGEQFKEFLQTTSGLKIHCVPCGSALKFGLLAEGIVDLYPRFGTTAIWDTAAGQCILEAAGGQVLNMQGKPLDYPLSGSLKNPIFLAVGNSNYNYLTYFKHFLLI